MTLGDRIKKYEMAARNSATPRMPLMIRVDGRAFHTFTKGCKRPFDSGIMDAMVEAAKVVAKDIQGFKAAYIQSDEATFCLTDYDTIETVGWFNYELPKIISISASLMSVAFNHFYESNKMPIFDSRAFSIPQDDVVNAFLWRAKDWERNSLQMYCRSFFSHKELHKKNKDMMHEMLFSIGKNWTNDLTDREKNGTYLINTGSGIEEDSTILPNYEDVSCNIWHLF